MDWFTWLDGLFALLLKLLFALLPLASASCTPQLILRDARDLSVLPLQYRPEATTTNVEVDQSRPGPDPRTDP